MRHTRRTVVLLAALTLLLVLALAPAAQARQAAPRADEVVLTMKGADGTVKTFTMTQLRAITDPAQGYYQGYAGFLNSANNLTPMHPVRGVKLASLLAMVGYNGATDVTAYASDGYGKLLSPQYVQGQGLVTYSDVKPYPQVASQVFTPVVVYDYKPAGQKVDDANSWNPEDEGPLRLWWALDTQPVPGFVVDGDMVVKWLNRITVTQTVVKQWTVNVKGPKKTYALTRKDFESCVAASCHGEKKVKWNGHTYSGLPFYYVVGKVDDNKDMNNWGDFNVKLAKKGYKIDVRSKSKKVTISSKLLVNRPQNIILAWKRDGKPLASKYAPLWLVGGKLTAQQRISAIRSIGLRNVPR